MKRITRIGLLTLVVGLGLAAVALLSSGLSVKADTDQVDLMVDAKAPTYVALGSTYVVNVSYANKGLEAALDNWVTVTLPLGTQFLEATYAGGAPRPPDEIDGNVLTWTLAPLVADSTWGHILIALQTDDQLPEGTVLTVIAEIATTAPEPDTSDNVARVSTLTSEMGGSTKQVQARIGMPGDVLTYTITIDLAQQPGAGASDRWVTLVDTLPLAYQARFLGWSGALTCTQVDSRTLRWQGRVHSNQSLSLQYRLGVEGVVTPGMVISNVAVLSWSGHQMQLGPVTTVVTVPHGVLGLGPNEGGQLCHSYGVTVEVPPGAVTDTTRFQLGPLFTDTHPVAPPGGLLFANRAFELNAFRFGEQIGQFKAPLTITVNYTGTDVAGLRRETLRLWTRSGPEGPWAVLGEPARVMSGTLSFTTTHFSQFALFGEAKHRVYLPLVVRSGGIP